MYIQPKMLQTSKLHHKVENGKNYNKVHHRFDIPFHPFKPSTIVIFHVIKSRPYIVKVFYCYSITSSSVGLDSGRNVFIIFIHELKVIAMGSESVTLQCMTIS